MRRSALIACRRTRSRWSMVSALAWPAHWNGVCGLGTNPPMETVQRMSRDPVAARPALITSCASRAIGYRYHDGEPSLIEGLLSRGDRRVGAVIRRVWESGGRFDGWSEHFSYQRWVDAAAEVLPEHGVDLDWYTTRERDELEVLPWDHLDSGLDKDWLWQDWQDSLSEYEQDDCRWTPCFDCGVCPSMDTEIQIGPTGRKLLPLTPVADLRVPG